MNFPDTPRMPQAMAAILRPKTTGAAIMVDRSPTPPIPIPMLAVSNAVSTPSIALTPRWYFCTALHVYPSRPRGAFLVVRSPGAGRTDQAEY